MSKRTPQHILETLTAVLSEHGLRGILVVPACTSRGRPFLQVVHYGYVAAEVDAILKEAIRCGETLQEAEAFDASSDEEESDP